MNIDEVRQTPDAPDSLILLGTAAGRTWHGGTERTGISSALVIRDSVYMIDCGADSGRRYSQAGLGTGSAFSGFENLRAIFVTHLHSDHIVGLAEMVTFGVADGLGGTGPVKLVGPGPRGALPPLAAGADKAPAIVAPANPTPGLKDTVRNLISAFASDINDNVRDSFRRNPNEVLDIHEITIPPEVPAHPDLANAPDMEPLLVYEDENVRVTAILVDHAPMFPAFAYRFETDTASIVFSGDTAVCGNVITLAQGADILVHEVIDPSWVESRFAGRSDAASLAKVHHLLSSHTSVLDIGSVAQKAEVKHLVLSHLAPVDNPDERWTSQVAGFSGTVSVGHDLDRIRLHTPTIAASPSRS